MTKTEKINPQCVEEDGKHFVFLPYSDLAAWTERIYTQTADAFGLYRLANIKALSFLTFIGPAPEDQYFSNFVHDRFSHSLVVALVVEQILRKNNFPKSDIDHGIVAVLNHDRATPALGDATKSIDHANLDEEDNWAEDLPKEAEAFIDKHGIKREVIDGIIKNQGVLGQILDIADRITYVTTDASMIAGPPAYWNMNSYPDGLRSVFRANTKLGNIYREVKVDQKTGEVFFTNPDRLKRFLLLRAILHQRLYLHPVSLGRDLLVANLIRPLYSADGKGELNPAKLRQMTDEDLMRHLYQHYQPDLFSPEFFYSALVNWFPRYEKCKNEEEANERAKTMLSDNHVVVLGIRRSPGFDPATSYKVRDKRGGIVPFRDFDRKRAYEIEAIEQSTRGVFLFYTDVSQPTPINNLLRRLHSKK